MNEPIDNQKGLLICDLDESLVHTVEDKPLPARPADFQIGSFHVYKRPHLDSFLASAFELFNIAIWSAGGDDYVHPVVRHLLIGHPEPAFVWTWKRCGPPRTSWNGEEYRIKDLKKVQRLGFNLARVLFLENTPLNLRRHYGNALYITSFEGDASDCELIKLEKYLPELHSLEDVRRIEKRGWSARFSCETTTD